MYEPKRVCFSVSGLIVPEHEIGPAIVTGLDQVVNGGRSEIFFPRRDQEDLDSSFSDLMVQLNHVWHWWCFPLPYPILEFSRVQFFSSVFNSIIIKKKLKINWTQLNPGYLKPVKPES